MRLSCSFMTSVTFEQPELACLRRCNTTRHLLHGLARCISRKLRRPYHPLLQHRHNTIDRTFAPSLLPSLS